MAQLRMKSRKGKWVMIPVVAVLAALVVAALWARPSQATPGMGVTLVKLADGSVSPPVDVKIKVETNLMPDKSNTSIDVARIQTYKITLAPGGTTGWHQHGGPHLIVVAEGTLTYYRGNDPTCTGETYPAGTSVFDPGYTTHLARNEGTVDVVNYVTQLLPDPGIFRIDIPAPGNTHCSF